MAKYVVRKLLMGVLTVFLVLTLNFVLVHSAPGDPANYMLGKEAQNPRLKEALLEKWGLNDPLPVQYWRYLKQLLRGDLGTSIVFNRPVMELYLERLPATLALIFPSSVIALVIGTALGIAAGRKEGGVLDFISSGASYVFNAMPGFWVGLMVIIIFASMLGWFPTSGLINQRAGYTGFRHYLDILHHSVLPLFTLVIVGFPSYFRIAKSSVLQVNNEDFITTFRATGMSEKKIFRKYVFKNAILPVVTIFGIRLAFLVAGASLVEMVFSWPGTGTVTLRALNSRDYPVLMTSYFIISVLVCVMTIISDLVYAALDPRIRY